MSEAGQGSGPAGSQGGMQGRAAKAPAAPPSCPWQSQLGWEEPQHRGPSSVWGGPSWKEQRFWMLLQQCWPRWGDTRLRLVPEAGAQLSPCDEWSHRTLPHEGSQDRV